MQIPKKTRSLLRTPNCLQIYETGKQTLEPLQHAQTFTNLINSQNLKNL